MEKYQVNVTLSNGIEINFSKEGESKEAFLRQLVSQTGGMNMMKKVLNSISK